MAQIRPAAISLVIDDYQAGVDPPTSCTVINGFSLIKCVKRNVNVPICLKVSQNFSVSDQTDYLELDRNNI